VGKISGFFYWQISGFFIAGFFIHYILDHSHVWKISGFFYDRKLKDSPTIFLGRVKKVARMKEFLGFFMIHDGDCDDVVTETMTETGT
jgi:hypothetical protein